MKKFDVELKYDSFYKGIEAKTREEAIEKAIEWFQECEPEIVDVTEYDDDEEDDE